MTLYILENKSYFNKNDTFLDWQKKNIFGVSLELNIQPQYIADIDFMYRLICYPGI